jgi:hypothetical protein
VFRSLEVGLRDARQVSTRCVGRAVRRAL